MSADSKSDYPTQGNCEAVPSQYANGNGLSSKDGSGAYRMDPDRRKQVEKSLKRKLDARCSLFVLIYIMNWYVRTFEVLHLLNAVTTCSQLRRLYIEPLSTY